MFIKEEIHKRKKRNQVFIEFDLAKHKGNQGYIKKKKLKIKPHKRKL